MSAAVHYLSYETGLVISVPNGKTGLERRKSMFSRKSIAVLVFTLVAAIAAPWVRAFATCPGAATGTCGTTTESSACACAPDGGFKSCTELAQSVCNNSFGHEIGHANWECSETNDRSKKCLNSSTVQDCWLKFPCKWVFETGKCQMDASGGALDGSQYVTKKIGSCAS